jgi:CRP-like cAMP-binding protein
VAIERLLPGEALGVSAVFEPKSWPHDARATSPVLAFAIDGACLRDKVARDSVFARAVLERLLEDTHARLERARLHQLDVYKTEVHAQPSNPVSAAPFRDREGTP